MNTFDVIRERRAVKHFDPSHQFEDSGKVSKLLSVKIAGCENLN